MVSLPNVEGLVSNFKKSGVSKIVPSYPLISYIVMPSKREFLPAVHVDFCWFTYSIIGPEVYRLN